MANTYMYEKMLATRHAETRHDMHLGRKPVYIEQSPTFVERITGKRSTMLGELDSRLQRAEQLRRVSI